MRVAHNLLSLNATNQLFKHGQLIIKSSEKLSSGLRINRAADDAAGLSISQKMRAQIAGLHMASRNTQDGISLIQTAEGALEEVHDMLIRMEELTVQAANDTYSSDQKDTIQQEISQLQEAINHISETTTFNTIKLFKSSTSTSSPSISAPTTPTDISTNSLTLNEAIAATKDNEISLFFDENIASHYETAQIPSGSSTISSYPAEFVRQLETEIVPNAIKSLTSTYSAFNYLLGSSVGIGLNLYADNSTTLAYVSLGVSGYLNSLDLSYQLAVNMNAVDWDAATQTITNRSDLEATIAHEMTHALMDEALTCGMLGISSSGQSTSKFPTWFTEGMAQAASGPGNWVRYALNLDATSTDSQIKTQLAKLNTNSNEANYGVGYLAATYLGYLANGGTGAITAANISNGLNNVLHSMISGNSLNDTIKTYTNGKYTSLSAFANNLKNDTGVCDFVRGLLSATGDGLGSVVSGNLSDTDVLPDSSLNINLFKVNTSTSTVVNNYGGLDVTPLSGGGVSTSGSKPVTTYPDSPVDLVPPTPPVDPFNINLSAATGVIKITTNGTYTISGTAGPGVHIEVADGVEATLNFSDSTLNPSSGSALSIGTGANVILNSSGTTTFTTGDSSNLTIDNNGTLTNTGSLTASINNKGTLNNTGTLTSSIKNTGTLDNTGNLTGALTNLGQVTNNGKINSIISNGGIIVNKGSITTTSSSGGEIRHYVKSVTKRITKPAEVSAGTSLETPSNASITVSYNGNKTATLNGSWSVSDGTTTTTDFPSLTAEAGKTYTYTLTFNSVDDIYFDSTIIRFLDGISSRNIAFDTTSEAISASTPTISSDGRSITYTYSYTAAPQAAPSPTPGLTPSSPDDIIFRIGNEDDEIAVYHVATLDTTSLGIDSLNVYDDDCTEAVKKAISTVSTIRSGMGALQNGLEHTLNNLLNTEENLTAAESRIRDTDMALEMAEYSKRSILIQATQAVLAQANNLSSNVLNLLR